METIDCDTDTGAGNSEAIFSSLASARNQEATTSGDAAITKGGGSCVTCLTFRLVLSVEPFGLEFKGWAFFFPFKIPRPRQRRQDPDRLVLVHFQ